MGKVRPGVNRRAEHVTSQPEGTTTAERDDHDAHRPGVMPLTDAIAQAKLTVGPAADPFEREADRVADDVVRRLSGSVSPGSEPQPQGSSVSRVQRAAHTVGAEGGAIDADTDQAIQSSRGGGRAMPNDVRRTMEGAFGADFSGIRVHEGPKAADLNDRIQAKAFTVGQDVFFRDGLPDTGSAPGQHLLAHELTHTIQQGGAIARTIDVSNDNGGAVRRLMPSKTIVERAVGPAEADKRTIFGGTKRKSKLYKPILAKLDALDKWLRQTKFAHSDPDAANAQLATYNGLLDETERALVAYIEHKGKEKRPSRSTRAKLAYMSKLVGQIGRERVVGAESSRKYQRGIDMGATWMGIVMGGSGGDRLAAPDVVNLDSTAAGPAHGGGTNQVTEYSADGIHSGFKQEATKVYTETELPDDAGDDLNNPSFMFADFGMDYADPRLAKRDVAMARLDQLLGGGVIARAELAVRHGKSGSLMDWSSNKRGTQVGAEAANPLEMGKDANLQRLMSRLHLIDILALQADRNVSNFLLEVQGGKVVGLTGIDNDMSFGTKMKGDVMWESRALQQYVDKELAERILRLKMDDVRWALADLLSEPELKGFEARLDALQKQLLVLQQAGGLLEPSAWTKQVADGMFDADKGNYYGKIRMAITGETKFDTSDK